MFIHILARRFVLMLGLGCLLGIFLFSETSVKGVDISPSKFQGGNSNAQPNKVTGAPGLLKNPFQWIFGGMHSEAMNRIQAPPDFKVDLATEPKGFMPGSNAVLKVRMTIFNQGKEKYILEFDTAQHYDFLIHDKDGREVYRSSADKIYTQQLSSMVINRNEKLVYEEELFSATNQAVSLPPGQYKLMGKVTGKTPITVETSFLVSQP